MGFKALSTVRSGATSVVSRQATVINTSQGFAATGASITSSTTINVEVVTPGQGTNVDPVSGGVAITSVNYLNANGSISTANAVSTAGGNIKINGTGFTSPMSVIVGSTSISNANVTVANTTAIIANLGSASPGNVSVYAFNASGTGAQLVNGVFYSGAPTWTTSAVSFQNGAAANVQLVASSDSTLTYTLQAGSSLPTGISLVSSGYLSGTPTGYNTNTSLSAVIVATDAEGQATQQTVGITIAVADPQFQYTTLLLNGDTGTNISNNATNNTFVDSSTNNFSITRTGTTTQGSFSPFSQTGWSVNFNRSRIDSTLTGKSPGTGSFTYELFFNVAVKDAAIANVAALFSTRGGGTGADGFDVEITTAGAVLIGTSGATLFTSSNELVTNGLWYHLAIVRNGTTNWTIYLNGSSIGTISNSTNFTSTNLYLGVFGGATQDWFKGNISNFRYTRSAVYTGNFTPQVSPLTVLANTEFLSCQSNRLIDNSLNNFAVTQVALNGSTAIQSFSPFAPGVSYTPSLHGGSAYFNGTGDYITVGTAPVTLPTATTPFTMEAWVYVTAFTGISIISTNYSSGAIPFMLGLNSGTNNTTTAGGYPIMYYYSGSTWNYVVQSTSANSTALKLNQWYHIAGVYTGSAATIYVNGTATVTAAVSTWTTTASAAGGINVGRKWDTSTGAYFSGYISDARVVVGTAVYSSNFTPPTAPLTPIANTNFLCNFTNGGIVDAHSSNVLETAGNAKLSTAVTKFGTASMSFRGAGDYLKFVNKTSRAIYFSSVNWTVEFWVYYNATGTYDHTLVGGTSFYDVIFGVFNYGGQIGFWNNNTFYGLYASSNLTAGDWKHIAYVRNGNTVTLYLNGTSVGSTAFSGSMKEDGANDFLTTVVGSSLNGYMDDVRITKGFARYTANFTVPSSPFRGQ